MGSLVDYRVGMGGCGGDDELLRKHKGIGDGAVFGVVDDWLEGSVRTEIVIGGHGDGFRDYCGGFCGPVGVGVRRIPTHDDGDKSTGEIDEQCLRELHEVGDGVLFGVFGD